MLIQTILFLILSLILTFIIIILNPQTPKAKLSKTIYRLLLSAILYLIITYFLAGFYDFNPLEVDKVTGIMINPYVALVSLILQFLNIFLLDRCFMMKIQLQISHSVRSQQRSSVRRHFTHWMRRFRMESQLPLTG